MKDLYEKEDFKQNIKKEKIMLKIGDVIRIKDGSWSVCLSKEWNDRTRGEIMHPHLDLSKEDFTIVGTRVTAKDQVYPQDIFIQSTKTNMVYLHSSCFVEKVVEEEWFKEAKRKDKFIIDGDEYILSHSGNSYMSLISLTNGNCWNAAIKCKYTHSITKEEFEQLTSSGVLSKEVYLTKH